DPGGGPRAQHRRLEGARRRHRRAGHRGEGGTRKDPRAGAKYRMMTAPDSGHRRGILMVISSPSGAGKTTLARALAQAERLEFSVSYTTRAPRPGERDGVDYKFVTDDEFTEMVGRKEFAEWAVVHGKRYGTAIHTVNRALDDGKDYLFDIDYQGGAQIRHQWPAESVLCFIL